MNINFDLDPVFSTYIVLLVFSGIAMLGLACLAQTSRGLRIANAVFGLGFFGYGLYLGFVFDGGGYLILFKAFILPGVLVFRTVKSLVSRPAGQPTPATAGGAAD